MGVVLGVVPAALGRGHARSTAPASSRCRASASCQESPFLTLQTSARRHRCCARPIRQSQSPMRSLSSPVKAPTIAASGRSRDRNPPAANGRAPRKTGIIAWRPRRAMTRRKLPIGIQTFRTLREQGCYYVDKTGYAKRLADEGGRYFLSRPRRFGKSLFLDTLKELFEGSEPLFRGLAVHEPVGLVGQPCRDSPELRGRRLHAAGLSAGGPSGSTGGPRGTRRRPGTDGQRAGTPAASDHGAARTHRPGRGGAGGRVRQADPRRPRGTRTRPPQPQPAARALRDHQGL